MLSGDLAHYRIVRLLGRGGMGEVYLAEDTRLKRRVAIKTVTPRLVEDPAHYRRRLIREAQAVAALNHPNIVTVHAIEEVEGATFIVLEFVDGQPLSALIVPGGLGFDRILSLIVPIADAVGAAHQARITHGDLKPSNAMLAADGRVKVLDFGLSTIDRRMLSIEDSASTLTMREEGVLAGTLAYMSPEQVEGRGADARSDVFALGVMLYELAAGARPFSGESSAALLSSILKDQFEPLRERRPETPAEFERIVRRCLAKSPNDRYQTATDLRNDLRELQEGRLASAETPVGAGAVSPSSRLSKAAVPIVIAAIALVAGAIAWPRLQFTGAESAPFSSVAVSALPIVWAGIPAVSPDGNEVAYSPDGARVVLRSLRDGGERTLLALPKLTYIASSFGPGGRDLFLVAGQGPGVGTLSRVSTAAGGSVRVVDDVMTAPAFAPDGRRFAVIRRTSPTTTALVTMGIDGSTPAVLATLEQPDRFAPSVSWSTAGRIAALTDQRNRDGRPTILIVTPETGHQETFAPALRTILQLAWLEGGRSLLVSAGLPGRSRGIGLPLQIYRVSFPTGDIHPITTAVGRLNEFAIASEAATAFVVRNDVMKATTWLTTVGPERSSRPLWPAPDAGHLGMNPVFWDDGQVVQPLVAGDNIHLWRLSLQDSARAQLTSDPGEQVFPRVSPSGRLLLFARMGPDHSSMWYADRDGRGATKLADEFLADPLLSHDDTAVYYVTSGGVERIRLSGGAREVVFDRAAMPKGARDRPKVSPDGRWVAVVVDHESGQHLEFLSTDPAVPTRRMPPIGANLKLGIWYMKEWTSDSRALVFASFRDIPAGAVGLGIETTIWKQPVDGGPPQQLDQFSGEQLMDLAVSPNGQQLLVTRGGFPQATILVTDTGRR